MSDQKRILLFSFDHGTGIGHLRRVARIAEAIQRLGAACLVVTDRGEMAELLTPGTCEYVRLPAWDSLLADKAQHWGHMPFLTSDRDGARHLRMSILQGVMAGFTPDAIVVDHIPLGGESELEDIVFHADCRKYLTTRGVQNETEDLEGLLFEGKARAALEQAYDAILVVTDRQVFDFTAQYDLGPGIAAKTWHVGYLAAAVEAHEMARCRSDRGASAGRPWVVATAGGGQNGERLIAAAMDLAVGRPDVVFDMVMGPRSRLKAEDFAQTVAQNPHIRLHRIARNMALMAASADLVICGGGYNTLTEAMQGSADIVVLPLRPSSRDEQHRNARLLSRFVNVELAADADDLPRLVAAVLARRKSGTTMDRRRSLNFGGADAVARRIMQDLGANQ